MNIILLFLKTTDDVSKIMIKFKKTRLLIMHKMKSNTLEKPAKTINLQGIEKEEFIELPPDMVLLTSQHLHWLQQKKLNVLSLSLFRKQ